MKITFSCETYNEVYLDGTINIAQNTNSTIIINHIDILLPPTFIEDISGINITVTTDSEGNDIITFD